MQELKPMDLSLILDKSFKLIFNKKFIKVFLLFLVLNIISIIIAFSITLAILGPSFFNFKTFTFSPKFFLIIPIIIIFFIFMIVTSLLYTGVSTDLFLNSFIGKEWNLKSSINKIKGKLGSFIFYYFLCSLIMLFIMIIFISLFAVIMIFSAKIIATNPFIILLVYILIIPLYFLIFSIIILLSMGIPSIIFEDIKGIAAIKRSIKLVKYNFWRILGSYIVFYLIISFSAYIAFFVLIIICAIIGLIVFFIYKFNFQNIFQNSVFISIIVFLYFIFVFLISFIYSGLSNAFWVSIFFNQKIKNENYGIELMAESFTDKKAFESEQNLNDTKDKT